MNPRTTGILFLVAALLGAFVWFYEIEGEAARQEALEAEKQVFPDVASDDVEEIALTTREGTPARLARGEDGWTLVEPLSFPADTFAADGIAGNLADLSSESVLEDPQPPEEYGLAEGARVVRFRAKGEEYALRVGDETPVGGGSYARVDGSDDVLIIPTYRATSFDKALSDLREKRILELDPAAVRRIEARWPGGEVVLERVAEDTAVEAAEGAPTPARRWRVAQPLSGRADDEVVGELLSNLSFLRATGFVDEPTQDQLAAFDEPAFDVRLTGTADDEGEAPTWRLRVGPVHEGDKRLVMAAAPSLYTISTERLADFPRSLVAYRFKRLADFDIGDAYQVDFFFHPKSGDPVAVSARRGDDGWTASPEPVIPGKLARLVSELSSLEALDIAAEEGSEEELAALGLSPPNTILTVFGEPETAAEEGEAEGEAAALPKLAEIHLGRVEGSEWIAARAAGDPALYRLSYELAEHVPVSLEAFRNRFQSDELPSGEAPSAEPEPGGLDFLTPSEESP